MKATVTKITKRITVVERRAEGIYSYDRDNNYPNRVKDIVAASSMGKSCYNTYRKFIFGKGFADENFAATALNRWNETADKILEKLSKDYAYFGGYALHVNYNANYKVSDIQYISLAQIRRTTPSSKHPGMYAVTKDWGCINIKPSEIRYIDRFNPDAEVIQEQVINAGGWQSYKGQIFYYSNEDGSYPLPIFDASLEDMETDAQTKTYKFRNVSTNFMATHVVLLDPMESSEKENEEGRGSGDEKETFIEDMEEFQGADNAQKLLVIEKTHPDQKIEFEKLEQQNGDRLYEWTESSTRNNIREAFALPAVLIMQTSGKLGGAQEIIDATKYYNGQTEDERLTVEATFMYLATLFERPLGDDFSIAPREAIRKEDIPSAILPDLTKNERRALAGYPELPAGDLQTRAEKLQVGGTQSFISVVTNPNLTPEEKRGTLKILFSLPPEEIDEIIPLVTVKKKEPKVPEEEEVV